jgi:TPR repeat protein
MFSSSASADFDVGLWFYENGDLQTAYKEFKRAAEFGHKQAQFNLGAMYVRGEYVPQDMVTGYAWLALSQSEQEEDDNALHWRLYERFDAGQQAQADVRYTEFLRQYADAAENTKPRLVAREREIRAVRSTRIINARYPVSMSKLSAEGWVDIFYTIDKDGTTRDHVVLYATHRPFENAVVAAIRASQHQPAMVNDEPVVTYGMRYRYFFYVKGGASDEHWIRQFVRNLRSKAQEGDADDIFNYAFYIDSLPSLLPEDTHVEFEDADDWFLQAATEGHAVAAYMLGAEMMRRGPSREASGLSWLMTAADNRMADARYILAMEMLSGARLQKDEEKAFHWLSQAAKGSPIARVRYAWVLSTHPDDHMRNHVLAEQLLDAVDKKHLDRQGYYQAHAAQAAEAGDFKAAVRWQKRALKDAKELSLPEDQLLTRLVAYESKKPWREAP